MQDQLYSMPGILNREKQRRIYYQDLVYSICNKIDARIGGTTITGTIERPLDSDVLERLDSALHRNDPPHNNL